MSFYSEKILPRLISWFMRRKVFAQLRAESLGDLQGTVLEIGFGAGLNLPFYPRAVERVIAVEPAALNRALATEVVNRSPIPVQWESVGAEGLGMASGSVDWVLSTWTLCTIADLDGALAEIRRVLKPGGGFRFLEHGRSPDLRVAKWQDRLTPLQKCIGGGCHLNRQIDQSIRAAGFELERLENFYMKGPRIGTYLYRGVARKSAKEST